MSKIIDKVKHELEEFAEKHAGYIPPSPSEIHPYMPTESTAQEKAKPDESSFLQKEEPKQASDPSPPPESNSDVQVNADAPISEHNKTLHDAHARIGVLINKKNEIEQSIKSVTSTLDVMHKSLSDVIENIEHESAKLTTIIKAHHKESNG